MDTRTGEIVDLSKIEHMPLTEKAHFVEVKRDLTSKEIVERQIKLYSPCACGSGKKFKKCCLDKIQ